MEMAALRIDRQIRIKKIHAALISALTVINRNSELSCKVLCTPARSMQYKGDLICWRVSPTAGVRCRQEGHGTQAPHPRRYARPAVERDRSPCRRAGSRWRPPSAADGASSVSLHRMHLRGCRISGAEDGEGHCRHRVLDIADRQAPRCPPLRRLAQAMDRRAHNRMDSGFRPQRRSTSLLADALESGRHQ